MNTNRTDCPRRPTFLLLITIAAALLLPSLVGCRSTNASPPARYMLATTFKAYEIQALSDRPATLVECDDHVLIRLADHRLRVEPGRVVLDDNETAAFPIEATQIVIETLHGTLRVTADSREMWKKPFPPVSGQ